jgi:hypothetical protein
VFCELIDRTVVAENSYHHGYFGFFHAPMPVQRQFVCAPAAHYFQGILQLLSRQMPKKGHPCHSLKIIQEIR